MPYLGQHPKALPTLFGVGIRYTFEGPLLVHPRGKLGVGLDPSNDSRYFLDRRTASVRVQSLEFSARYRLVVRL
jgi:hypothetical protein